MYFGGIAQKTVGKLIKMASRKPADYKADKAAVKDFLAMFYVEDNDADKGDKGKVFTYADQIQALAEREQVRHRFAD